jgi:hypothetical protein
MNALGTEPVMGDQRRPIVNRVDEPLIGADLIVRR